MCSTADNMYMLNVIVLQEIGKLGFMLGLKMNKHDLCLWGRLFRLSLKRVVVCDRL